MIINGRPLNKLFIINLEHSLLQYPDQFINQITMEIPSQTDPLDM